MFSITNCTIAPVGMSFGNLFMSNATSWPLLVNPVFSSAGLTYCQARNTLQLDFSYNASFSALNVAKVMMKENEQPYSMASFNLAGSVKPPKPIY